jgi:alpha/beta hydrolase fold
MTTAMRDMQVENLGDYEARVLFPEAKPNPLTTKYATVFSAKKPLQLELGGTLAPVRVAYTTYGTLNEARDNAVVVCHALTGSSQVGGADGWWPELIGPGRMLDTDRDFVICSNVLGGCYGTTGPASPEPETGRDYGPNFPEITIADMVRVQRALADHLNIGSIRAVVGGSMGGMLALDRDTALGASSSVIWLAWRFRTIPIFAADGTRRNRADWLWLEPSRHCFFVVQNRLASRRVAGRVQLTSRALRWKRTWNIRAKNCSSVSMRIHTSRSRKRWIDFH